MMTPTELAPGFASQDDFGDVRAEYHALRDTAGLVDRSNRLRMLFTGGQPAATLTGLVTNDVVSLRSGEGQFAGALTAKGKVIADLRILARTDDVLVDCGEDCGPAFAAMIRRYVNPRLAKYTDVSAVLRCVGVYGPDSAAAVAAVLSCDTQARAAPPSRRAVQRYASASPALCGNRRRGIRLLCAGGTSVGAVGRM